MFSFSTVWWQGWRHQDAGIEVTEENAERIGVNIGSGIGGLPMIEDTDAVYHEGGPRKISPFFIPGSIINMISGNLSIMYGFKGPNLAIVTACTTATHCIGDSARLIEYGDADVMIAAVQSPAFRHWRLAVLLRRARYLRATTIRQRPVAREMSIAMVL